ncbi:DoxX family protein [Streptomyces sp. NPDC048419]|uniref:DoxX family protein n=1 Tax=Streptomyces sp. NPDC048419 TaxID=3365547 RepID=UPI00371277ED
MNVALWVGQALLALVLVYSGALKVSQSGERLVEMGQTGAAVFPLPLIRFVASCELLGAVLRPLTVLSTALQRYDLHLERRTVNAQPGVLIRDPLGGLLDVPSVDVIGGKVHTIHSILQSPHAPSPGTSGRTRPSAPPQSAPEVTRAAPWGSQRAR